MGRDNQNDSQIYNFGVNPSTFESVLNQLSVQWRATLCLSSPI